MGSRPAAARGAARAAAPAPRAAGHRRCSWWRWACPCSSRSALCVSTSLANLLQRLRAGRPSSANVLNYRVDTHALYISACTALALALGQSLHACAFISSLCRLRLALLCCHTVLRCVGTGSCRAGLFQAGCFAGVRKSAFHDVPARRHQATIHRLRTTSPKFSVSSRLLHPVRWLPGLPIPCCCCGALWASASDVRGQHGWHTGIGWTASTSHAVLHRHGIHSH